MTEYMTHDVRLDLGGEAAEDLTLNMLRFANRGTTLVLARSPRRTQQDLGRGH